MPSGDEQLIAACQRLQLIEIARLFEELDSELERCLRDEQAIADELPALAAEIETAKNTVLGLGDVINRPEAPTSLAKPGDPQSVLVRYKRLEFEGAGSYDQLAYAARDYLSREGIDLRRDPLLQVLSTQEICNALSSYRKKYGDISWDPSDYLVVTVAGLLATLIDIFIVRTPETALLLKRFEMKGSPATTWVKENTQKFYEEYLKGYEGKAKVPYDITHHPDVKGLYVRQHRQMSLEHNLIFGPILAILSCVSGKVRLLDKFGNVITVDGSMDPMGLQEAILKVLLHFLTDIFTKAGLSPTFLTLLQLIDSSSPFSPTSPNVKVSWRAVAHYMYRHGYDVQHFLVSGLVPGTIDAIIRGYWWLSYYDDEETAGLSKLKLSTMLLMGHSIATSGTLIKTGVLFEMDPLALNWAELLRMAPALVSFVIEAIKRDARIKAALEAEWTSIYESAANLSGL